MKTLTAPNSTISTMPIEGRCVSSHRTSTVSPGVIVVAAIVADRGMIVLAPGELAKTVPDLGSRAMSRSRPSAKPVARLFLGGEVVARHQRHATTRRRSRRWEQPRAPAHHHHDLHRWAAQRVGCCR